MGSQLRDRVKNLPPELKSMVAGYAVRKAGHVSLSNLRTESANLIAPFRNTSNVEDIELMDLAAGEVLLNNVFTVQDSNVAILYSPDNEISGLSFGNMAATLSLADLKPIKHIEIIARVTLTGCNWDIIPTPLELPASTTALADALPTLLPMLQSATVKALNLGSVTPNPAASYTWKNRTTLVAQNRRLRSCERAARIRLLFELVTGTIFPPWRNGHTVEKNLVLVQSLTHADGGHPTRKMGARIRSDGSAPGTPRDERALIWSMCDWPRVEGTFF